MVTVTLGPISPFFIVKSLAPAVSFYEQKLGFETRVLAPPEEPFFAIVGRGSGQILLKEISPDVSPTPNHSLHEWAPWDAYVHASDPDRLAEEFAGRGCAFHEQLATRDDGLRGFEVIDADGYVLFFGSPASE